MAEQASFSCEECGGKRLFTRAGTNHILHLLLSVFTLGIWIPIWVLITVHNRTKSFFCSRCGWEKEHEPIYANSAFGDWLKADANKYKLGTILASGLVIYLIYSLLQTR